jgi:hypothetical protein
MPGYVSLSTNDNKPVKLQGVQKFVITPSEYKSSRSYFIIKWR